MGAVGHLASVAANPGMKPGPDPLDTPPLPVRVPYEIVKAIYRQGTLKDDTVALIYWPKWLSLFRRWKNEGLEAVRMELAEFVEWSEVAGQDEGKVESEA